MTPQFRLAEADYGKGRYLQVAALVEALERQPGNSGSQREYLERQRKLCQDAAATRKLVRAPGLGVPAKRVFAH